jgi:hypothetical protein
MSDQLKTPTDFSNYYYKKLKEELNVSDLNLNRLGFIGFFIELLGNTQFDVKNYYDHLFNESFPISARENQNLLYHSSVFGYDPVLATPSLLNGIMEFDFDQLISQSSGIKTREYEIKNLIFRVDDIRFSMDYNYKIICTNIKPNIFSVTGEIYKDNDYDIMSLKYSHPKIPLIGFKQYESEESTRYLPKYPYGSFHILDIELADFLYDVSIFVREKHSSKFEPYETKISKSETLGNDKVVFYNILPNHVLRLEFGSGIYGNYIPESEVKIIIKTTKGAKGNIGSYKSSDGIGLEEHDIYKFDYNFNDVLINSEKILNPHTIIKSIYINQSDGGLDSELDNGLKNNLIKFIQSRDNLVSQTDYNNIIEPFFPNSDVLFKKSGITENIIYVYSYFLNNYKQPFYTLTQSILKEEFDSNIKYDKSVYPTFLIDGVEFVSPFLYEWDELLGLYNGFIFNDDINFYPSKSPFVAQSAPINLKNELFDASLTFLNLVYDIENNITRIYIKNKYFNNDHTLKLTCVTLGIDKTLIKKQGDLYYYEYFGIIKNPSIFVLSFVVDSYMFEYYFNNVRNVEIADPLLKLKIYRRLGQEYIINVPLIDSYKFKKNEDMDYLQNSIKNNFINVNIDNNRMISDDVQVRFSNTYFVKNNIVKKITKQNIDTDIKLPLKLDIDITLDKNDVIINSVSIPDIIENIRVEVSKFILSEANGINLKYYNTQVVDICHNFDYVKSCNIRTYDSNGTIIPNGIETLHKNNFIPLLTKEEFLNFSSVYWWFDINNISIKTFLI